MMVQLFGSMPVLQYRVPGHLHIWRHIIVSMQNPNVDRVVVRSPFRVSSEETRGREHRGRGNRNNDLSFLILAPDPGKEIIINNAAP